MTKLVAAMGGLLLIGATIVLLFTALFSGQMASYSGGVCLPETATSTVGISPTKATSPTTGISCFPASGNGSNVSMAALTGLALALLAGTIAGLVSSAAKGQ